MIDLTWTRHRRPGGHSSPLWMSKFNLLPDAAACIRSGPPPSPPPRTLGGAGRYRSSSIFSAPAALSLSLFFPLVCCTCQPISTLFQFSRPVCMKLTATRFPLLLGCHCPMESS
ncbi:hypothetical protein CDAR_40471 [Caerostris darwini]|uniref:Uncharacterized protein n=1 Tax=Caerostris darwini TaxID=1538125 RepID=A0AAV4R9Z5_9ARAC|nr:hypothetical protein CDAR_40471 [Caerostris darwini]